MRKIVNGKMFDTERAIMLAQYWNGLGSNDFKYVQEEVYVTEDGRLVFLGQGGGLSVHAHRCDEGGTTEGEDIYEMDMDDFIILQREVSS